MDKHQWGREIIIADESCSFSIVPVLDGEGPNASVVSLHKLATFRGDEDYIQKYLTELEEFHIGRAAGLLINMGQREHEYQEYPPTSEAPRRAAQTP